MKLLLTSSFGDFQGDIKNITGINPTGLKTLLVSTAADAEAKKPDADMEWYEKDIARLKQTGAEIIECKIQDYTEDEFKVAIQAADIIYVSGGHTSHLLNYMRQVCFGQHLKTFLDRGGLYIGCSAGSIVTGPDIGFLYPGKEEDDFKLDDTTALNIIPWKIIPHYESESYMTFATRMLEAANEPLLCIRDHQALYINDHSHSVVS
jgi:dipeptidase E